MEYQSYKELIVWQRAMQLVPLIYSIVSKLPYEENGNLKYQMRKSAVSIPCNIAEGKSRRTKKDYAQFLRIALGSLTELETQLYITNTVYKIEITEAQNVLIEIQKMLAVLIKKITY